MAQRRRWLFPLIFMSAGLLYRAHAQEASILVPGADAGPQDPGNGEESEEHLVDSDEAEEKGIIPHAAGVFISTQPITPTSVFPDKPLYISALESLARAEELYKKGEYESASDLALEAYDDLMEIPLPRKRKKKSLNQKRNQLKADRERAATVYVQSSIEYVQGYVKKQKNTPAVLADGRERLGDLRDVAVNYTNLNTLLNQALAQMQIPTK